MANQRWDGYDKNVKIAGGIGDLWSLDFSPTGGIIQELADGSEHFLCLDCVDALPDDHDSTAEDVAVLPTAVDE